MRPGATFCAACGHAISAPLPAARGDRPSILRGTPNPRAAAAIAAMPIAMVLALAVFALRAPTFGPDLEAIGISLVLGLVVGGLAWAVWRGATWARWVSIAGTLAWGIFMAWVTVDQVRQLRDPLFPDYSEYRRMTTFGLLLSCVELGLAAAALYFLFFPGRARGG